MGVQVDETDDGATIHGGSTLGSGTIESHGDHRIAMSLAVAGLVADGETIVEDSETIAISYPGFERTLAALIDR
jgi:3-phosphoshikimate 1-carboxyvinyltransferase